MILTGLCRLGRDAEVRYTPAGDAVAQLALAYNYGKKDDDGIRPTQWVNASLWGKRAEALAPHLTKGGVINAVIQGVHIETYDKKDGGTGFNLVGIISDIEFTGGGNKEAKPDQPNQQRQAPQSKAAPPTQSDNFDNFDDPEIPF